MYKWLGLTGFILVLIMILSILGNILHIKQIDSKLADYRLDTAIKRNKTATVELENALYRRWVNQMLYKEVQFKDESIEEVEQFKRDNGFYEGEEE